MQRKPKFMGLFRILLIAFIALCVVGGVYRFLVQSAKNNTNKAQEESRTIQAKITDIEDSAQYQKISFVSKLHKNSKQLPRSDHIKKLIDVLQEIQSIDNGNDTLELYDFNVNLDTIEISGKVSHLKLLYYPKGNNRQGLISKVSELDFLDDIRIQSYIKEDGMYTFTLYATILLDETTQ